jgi:hypothetical protein
MFLQILEIIWKGYSFVDHALLPEKQFSPQKSGNLIQTSFFTLLSFLLKNLKAKKLWMGRTTLLSSFTAAGAYIVPSAVHSSKCNKPELAAAALQVPQLC